MGRALIRMLAAATTAAALSASGFTITAAAQSDQQPTHAELVQRWAEAALDAQLKSMKTSLRLTADQEKDWGPFESAVKDSAKARVVALQKEQGNNLSPMDRLNAKAERLTQGTANLETIVEAAKPLYASLNETQKHDVHHAWPHAGARAWALCEGDEAPGGRRSRSAQRGVAVAAASHCRLLVPRVPAGAARRPPPTANMPRFLILEKYLTELSVFQVPPARDLFV